MCVYENDNRIQTNVPLLFVLYFVRLIVNRNRNLISVKLKQVSGWARNRCVCFFSLLSPVFFFFSRVFFFQLFDNNIIKKQNCSWRKSKKRDKSLRDILFRLVLYSVALISLCVSVFLSVDRASLHIFCLILVVVFVYFFFILIHRCYCCSSSSSFFNLIQIKHKSANEVPWKFGSAQ